MYGCIGPIVPEGQPESSPAFERRVRIAQRFVPEGHLIWQESARFSRPAGTNCFAIPPGVKTPGFFHYVPLGRKRHEFY